MYVCNSLLSFAHTHQLQELGGGDVQRNSAVSLNMEKVKSMCMRWVGEVLTPSRHVVWINTDNFSPTPTPTPNLTPTPTHTSTTNPAHLAAVKRLVEGLEVGNYLGDLVLLSVFKDQTRELAGMLADMARRPSQGSKAMDKDKTYRSGSGRVWKASTIDAFQGGESDMVVLDLVRAKSARKGEVSGRDEDVEDEGGGSKLLQDWRRIYVALSRAKSKLVVLGSLQYLRSLSTSPLSKLAQLFADKKWVVDLPADALLATKG
eukprot:gene42637-52099_t